MPISEYLRGLRSKIGHDLVLVPSVTALVYDDQGRILLVRHSDRQNWVAPGGSIDPHERPADAVVREMWEETGLLVVPERIMGVYGGPEFQITYANGDAVSYVMTVFECRIVEGQMRPDGEETLEVRYCAADDLANLNLSPWARIVLPDAFLAHTHSHFQPPQWTPPT